MTVARTFCSTKQIEFDIDSHKGSRTKVSAEDPIAGRWDLWEGKALTYPTEFEEMVVCKNCTLLDEM